MKWTLLAVAMFISLGAHASPTDSQTARPQVEGIYPEIENLYIDLHRNPELAFHETRTAAVLAERLRKLGYRVTTGVGGTGIVAILSNGTGPTVMFRTELDGLPIEEKTGLPFASVAKTKTDAGETVSVGHMCGHDLHMAAWAGTAALMATNKSEWHGTLMLVGQPAEETWSGAAAMLKDGLFTRFPKPDFALGMHDEPTLPAGVIGFHPGYFRAASDRVDITVYGKGGHGAMPQNTVDPVVLAAKIILGLQTIVSRENNPLDPAVITVGTIHGGTARNIIPDQVKLELTVRTFDPDARKKIAGAIERVAKGEAIAANAPKTPLVDIQSGTDAVYNDPDLTQRVVATARAALGADQVMEMRAKMASEDFSQYGLAGVRSVLLHIGAVDRAQLAEAKSTGTLLPDLHSSYWAPVREPTIKAAITAETAILIDLMKAN